MHHIISYTVSSNTEQSCYTIRYATIDDLHWKTDRQAAS